MNAQEVDREMLKSVVAELLFNDPKYFKHLLTEILLEHEVIAKEEPEARRRRLEQLINEDFDKYDEVFKRLA